MKTHVEELIEKWEGKERQEWEQGAKAFNDALLMCMEDLDDALLLDEADRVTRTAPQADDR